MGFRVLAARNGEEAIMLGTGEQPDLAVLDIAMPVLNGLDALQQLKALWPGLPVILFTAYDEDCLDDRRAGLASACVEKSDNLSLLEQTIFRLLGSSRQSGGPGTCRVGLPPVCCSSSV